MHLLRFALVRVGRGWFKGNAHESAAFTVFRAMRDVCTRVCHIVVLVELSTPLLFFWARLHHKGPNFAYQGQQVRFKIQILRPLFSTMCAFFYELRSQ